MEYIEEEHFVLPRKPLSNSDRAIKAIEATTLFPDTTEGIDASMSVLDLIDTLHRARLDSIEGIFTNIRLIFESFKIHLDI